MHEGEEDDERKPTYLPKSISEHREWTLGYIDRDRELQSIYVSSV